jgi:DNA-binding transcriptional LysR family regulator
MYLRYLQYLQAVVEHGSFARAAQACGVSQPAVSHGMKVLQSQWKKPLLVLEGRRYVPTPQGRLLALQAGGVQAQMAALGQQPAARQGQALPALPVLPVLRVGLTPSAALVCGHALYASWCLPHPGHVLEMTTTHEGELLSGLLQGQWDAVIAPRPRRFAHPDLLAQELYRLRPQVYLRQRHPLCAARSLAQLHGAGWACVGAAVSGPVDVLAEAHAVRGLPLPRMVVRCADFASMVQLLAQTDLLAVVPHPSLLGAAAGQLMALPLNESLPLYSMGLFTLRSGGRKLAASVLAALRAAGDPGDVGEAREAPDVGKPMTD